MTEILTVKDVFLIEGRGIVAVCRCQTNTFNIRIGKTVQIIRPAKTTINTQIDDIDAFTRQCFSENPLETIGFLFSNLSRKDIPKGSTLMLS